MRRRSHRRLQCADSGAASRKCPARPAAIVFNDRAWGILGDSFPRWVLTRSAPSVRGAANRACFKNPRGLAVDGQGNFWVADTGNDRLQKFSREGNLLHGDRKER